MTKQIPLSQGKFALVDDADYEWLNQWKWCADPNGYAVRAPAIGHRTNAPRIKMHREVVNAPKGMIVDHIDGNPSNNTRSNLRVCSHRENIINSKIRSNNQSGYKGVNKNGRRWRAGIKVNNANLHLGYFDTPKEAAAAYNVAAIKYFGEFARLNTL